MSTTVGYTYHIWLHPKHEPILKLARTHNVNEDFDLPGNDVYHVLSRFKPSSLDHKTIAREIHEHLAKHGYYSHSSTHPLVRSPRDNENLIRWARVSTGRKAKHEGFHRDFTGDKRQSKDSMVGVWSTNNPTQISRGDDTPVPAASKAGHVTVFNDRIAKHKASEVSNRWFVRAHNIRKIPENGQVTIGKKTFNLKSKAGFSDYVNSKKASRKRFHENIKKWLKDPKNQTKQRYAAAKSFVRRNYRHLLKSIGEETHTEFNDLFRNHFK